MTQSIASKDTQAGVSLLADIRWIKEESLKHYCRRFNDVATKAKDILTEESKLIVTSRLCNTPFWKDLIGQEYTWNEFFYKAQGETMIDELIHVQGEVREWNDGSQILIRPRNREGAFKP